MVNFLFIEIILNGIHIIFKVVWSLKNFGKKTRRIKIATCRKAVGR